MNARTLRAASVALFSLGVWACSDATSDATASSAADLGPAKADGGSGGEASGGDTGGSGGVDNPGGAGGEMAAGGTGGEPDPGGAGGQPSPGGTGGLTPDDPCTLPEGPDARTADYDLEMARFVGRLQAYADCRKPGFLVFPQNAA